MIDNYFRALLPRHVAPLIRLIQGLGLKPNHVTALGLLLALVAVYLVTRELFVAAFVVWWSSRLLDALDGIYARASQQTSDFGAFLDIQFDMLAYSAMVLGFAWVYPEYSMQWLLMLFCYVLCISGALGLGAFENKRGIADGSGRGLRIAVGLAEGGETGIAYSVFLLAPAWLSVTTWVWVAILVITIVARLVLASAELGSKKS